MGSNIMAKQHYTIWQNRGRRRSSEICELMEEVGRSRQNKKRRWAAHTSSTIGLPLAAL